MSIEVNAGSLGSAAWKFLNTGLGAAGTAMGATALGSKCSEEKVREIFREEMGRNGKGCTVNDTVVVSQPCSDNTHVNRFELAQNLEIARLQAKEYSDMSDLKLFEDYTTRLAAEKERVNGRFETIFSELVASRERLQAEVCRLDKEAALNKQATDFGFYFCQSGICTHQQSSERHNQRGYPSVGNLSAAAGRMCSGRFSGAGG